MADPIPSSAPKGKGLFGKLNPKQKRLLAIGGIALLLAIVYLLSRRSSGEGSQADREAAERQRLENEELRGGGGAGPYYGGGETGAVGQLGENLSSDLGVISNQVGETQAQIGEVGGSLGQLGADVASLQQEVADQGASQDEANERWLSSANDQSASLKKIAKELEHKTPSKKKQKRNPGHNAGKKAKSKSAGGHKHPKQPRNHRRRKSR